MTEHLYSLQWLIGIGMGGLVAGALLGLALGRTLFRSRKSKELEQELASAQNALRDYRAEVYDQFAETARKFETLDSSYRELHRHLASSAVALLGETATTPLLRAPEPAPAVEPIPDPAVDAQPALAEAAALEPDPLPTQPLNNDAKAQG